MECVVCGGTNFTKESGYFFCSECQTQSQELKEHAFQEEGIQTNAKNTRKIKDKKSKTSDNMTSWECYNVIIMVLTEELIKLGVDRSIKKIVKCLWFRYLEKLEVLNLEQDEKPKLSLIHTKRDINITYGITKKRKRKKSSSEESSFTESTSRRERTKKKRALAQAQYAEYSIRSKTEGSSLIDETLTSLKSNSDKSIDNKEICFNKFSNKELKNVMSRHHLKQHKKDLNSEMNCHKLNSRTVSSKYASDVYFISPVKIYSILYIGLLIKKDPLQIGDLFRLMREGHLSFNSYTSLFPENYGNKVLNIENNTLHNIFGQLHFRKITGKLVKYLKVEKYIKCPNLIELAERYCKELNLPDDVFSAVKNILANNPPKLKIIKSCIPNYEGKIMSIIIFVLKLLYGLDDVSETNLSHYARAVNAKWKKLKMFDIVEWMEFISYRKLVISEYHFPSHILANDKDMSTDLFLQYKKNHNVHVDDRTKLIVDMQGYKDLLTKIESLQYDYITHIEFPADIYPFNSHLKVVMNLLNDTGIDNVNQEILMKNHQDSGLDCLLRPIRYLWQLNKDGINYVNGGLNDNWRLKKMKTLHSLRKLTHYKLKYVPAEIVTHKVKKIIEIDNKSSINVQEAQENFLKYHKAKFQANFQKLMELKLIKTVNLESDHNETYLKYSTHCFPYERYWLYLTMTIDHLSQHEFEHFFKNFSNSFKLVVEECARVVEQTNLDLYKEFQRTELYLIYCANKYNGSKKRKKLSNLGLYLRLPNEFW